MEKTLDVVLNKLGYEIVEEIKNQGKQEKQEKQKKVLFNHIDKSLGVLANDGVYAYYVFCISKDKPKEDKKCYRDIFIKKPVEALGKFFRGYNNANYEEFFQNLSQNLENLLFFKELLEQALIYARYHAKAAEGEKNE